MVTALAALVLGFVGQSAPKPYANRVEFARLYAKIQGGWTKAQVQAVLGPPDQDWSQDLDQLGHPCGSWRYGTEGFGSRPSLGSVPFTKGRVDADWLPDRQPQSPLSMFNDEALYGYLERLLHLAPQNTMGFADPLFYSAATEILRPLGKQRALSVLVDYSRFSNESLRQSTCIFWLVRVMFTSRRGYFAWPALGGANPRPPTEIRQWPDFPMLVVDGVPFALPIGFTLAGDAQSFEGYVRDNQADWVLRNEPLQPTDDPFVALAKALTDSRWKLIQSNGWQNRSQREEMTGDLLESVRTVLGPGLRLHYLMGSNELASDHAKYLELGGHWDAKQLCYVRRDGLVTPN